MLQPYHCQMERWCVVPALWVRGGHLTKLFLVAYYIVLQSCKETQCVLRSNKYFLLLRKDNTLKLFVQI